MTILLVCYMMFTVAMAHIAFCANELHRQETFFFSSFRKEELTKFVWCKTRIQWFFHLIFSGEVHRLFMNGRSEYLTELARDSANRAVALERAYEDLVDENLRD